MPDFKEIARLVRDQVIVMNALGRLEAKLDALMAVQMEDDELKGVKLPKEMKVPSLEVDVPYNVQQGRPVSTITVPRTPDNVAVANPVSGLENMSTIPLPEGASTPPITNPFGTPFLPNPAMETDEPIPGYNNMTVGEILKEAKNMDDAGRERLLAYERQRKEPRKTLVDALVNWNS